jgi:predicted PurR-regulated permease PerM
VDSVFLMVLVFICLLAPVFLAKDHSAAAPAGDEAQSAVDAPAVPAPTWESLGQTPVQAQQWEKLGHTPETAKPIVENRFDYTVELVPLAVTALVIVGYFVLMLRWSDREYREVIRERFGEPGGRN